MDEDVRQITMSNIDGTTLEEKALFVSCNTMCLLIIPFNEVIDWWLTASYDKMTTSKLYRQQNKFLINKAKKEMKTLISVQKSKYKSVSESIYFTYVDFYADKLNEHVSKVQKLIYDEMIEHNVKYAEELSYIETTRILMVLQMQAYNELISDVARNHSRNLSLTERLRLKNFLLQANSSYKCEAPLGTMQNLVDKLFHNEKGFDLNKNEELKNAVEKIQNIMAEATYLDEAAEESLKTIKNG